MGSICKALLQAKASADAQDAEGRTPLHLAILGGESKLTTLLENAGASNDIKDSQGRNAAAFKRHVEDEAKRKKEADQAEQERRQMQRERRQKLKESERKSLKDKEAEEKRERQAAEEKKKLRRERIRSERVSQIEGDGGELKLVGSQAQVVELD